VIAYVNLGLEGYGGEQELLALRRWAALLPPPAVILYLGYDNDFQDDLLFKSGYRHKHIVTGSPFWGWMAVPLQWLTNDFQLGIRMKMALAQLRQRSIQKSAHNQREQEVRSHSVAELESPVLARLVTYANAYGAWLVVSWSDAGPSYDWLKSWATQNGIAFADWVPKVNSVRAVIPALPEDNQHSGGHHRAWVNRLIADEFARQIWAIRRKIEWQELPTGDT
jgi:hypothetical protein